MRLNSCEKFTHTLLKLIKTDNRSFLLLSTGSELIFETEFILGL